MIRVCIQDLKNRYYMVCSLSICWTVLLYTVELSLGFRVQLECEACNKELGNRWAHTRDCNKLWCIYWQVPENSLSILLTSQKDNKAVKGSDGSRFNLMMGVSQPQCITCLQGNKQTKPAINQHHCIPTNVFSCTEW